jgi:hypothetical protein
MPTCTSSGTRCAVAIVPAAAPSTPAAEAAPSMAGIQLRSASRDKVVPCAFRPTPWTPFMNPTRSSPRASCHAWVEATARSIATAVSGEVIRTMRVARQIGSLLAASGVATRVDTVSAADTTPSWLALICSRSATDGSRENHVESSRPFAPKAAINTNRALERRGSIGLAAGAGLVACERWDTPGSGVALGALARACWRLLGMVDPDGRRWGEIHVC